MSLFNALRTSTSGLSAQSSYLSAIGDNIANSGTTGYKEASTQFETVLGQQTPGSYQSGGVLAQTRYNVTDQGTLTATTSSTDLAINGNGFFVVTQGNSAGQYLTRAGSFVPDNTGNLVNAAGYTLQGYQIGPDGQPATTLSAVNVSSTKLVAAASTSGTIVGNLPSTDAAPNPNATPPVAGATHATTATFYDSQGTPITATLTYAKQDATTWTVTATDAGGQTLGSGTLAFSATTGALTSGSPLTISTAATGGTPVKLDVTGLTQLATTFSSQPTVNGSAPSTLASVTVGTDGTVTGVYGSGIKAVLYDIPVATVTSPDNLTAVTGDLYQQSNTSGTLNIGKAGSGAAGSIEADNLESSTVDIATELTNLIVAQRAYEANTKVLQAASDLLSKLDQIQTG